MKLLVQSCLYCLLVSILLGSAVQAQIPRCPTEMSSSSSFVLKKHTLQKISSLNIEIPVAFHIIHSTGGAGNISDSVIDDQIDVLNSAFSAAGVSFYLLSIDRTADNDWYDDLEFGTQIEDDVKQALTIDPEYVLNIYTADIGDLGWARFPWEYDEDH